MEQYLRDMQDSYDRVAPEYGRLLFHELDGKPLDRDLLERFARLVKGKGKACDLGCGPGQIAAYLKRCGLTDLIGIDLSPVMVEEARRLNPGVEFRVGNMMELDLEDASLAGIAAFYSLVHIPRSCMLQTLRELRRVLIPGGILFLTFHIGTEIVHPDEYLHEKVSIDWIFFTPEEMEAYLREAGFEIDDSIERSPYRGVEHPSRRAYIFTHSLE